MTRNKKIFLGFAIVFFALLFYASYDIATRTTFPGAKPQLKERIEQEFIKPDSVKNDTTDIK
ncbi:MAG: hypothetical protein KF725_06520 [Cyclobacteriaceae bacterium]|nr:hypothetical protein [Cyclobacteriaceae bacterium]UYN88416.1 MAG: hypothetical protein KIT51_09290 [Cyclobacteriaceae bacterium]